MFVLLSGEAKVVATSSAGEKKEITMLNAGDMVGELAFLNHAPRSADVIATRPVEALVLSPESINKVLAADSKIAAKVYQNLSKLVAQRLTKTTQRILEV